MSSQIQEKPPTEMTIGLPNTITVLSWPTEWRMCLWSFSGQPLTPGQWFWRFPVNGVTDFGTMLFVKFMFKLFKYHFPSSWAWDQNVKLIGCIDLSYLWTFPSYTHVHYFTACICIKVFFFVSGTYIERYWRWMSHTSTFFRTAWAYCKSMVAYRNHCPALKTLLTVVDTWFDHTVKEKRGKKHPFWAFDVFPFPPTVLWRLSIRPTQHIVNTGIIPSF